MNLFMQDKHSQTNLLLGVECAEFLQILSDRAETFKKYLYFEWTQDLMHL